MVFALIVTIALTGFWAGLAWRDLGALRLLDADDMLRLARIRDWLDGQAVADAVQQRLGPPGGTALHWSRLPELVPALLIGLLSPIMGTARAEIAAVIFWPELLLFAHLLLVGAIARALGGGATVAVLLAAAAVPAADLFLPGRIDHHGLQVVLVEVALLCLIIGRTLPAGLAAGLSLLVGVETAPVLAALMAAAGALWVAKPRAIAGFGAGLLASAIGGYALFRTDPWPDAMCDGFTQPALTLMMIAGAGWLVLAALSPRLPDVRWRAGAALTLVALALAGGWALAPSCFASPYGPADPIIAAAWPAQPGELGGVSGQSAGTLLAWLALPLIALGAAAWFAWTRRTEAWLFILAVIAVSLLTACFQLRGAWFAAALSAPVLAQMVVASTRRGAPWQIAAWIGSIGLIWQAIGELGLNRGVARIADCSDRGTLAALDRLDTGAFAAPMTLSAALIGGTQHRALGGPYHRNRAGNRALAELFRASPEAARLQANLWAVDYIALCPTADGGLPEALRLPNGLGGHLVMGAVPDWLDEVSLVGSDLRVWRVQLGPVMGPPR